MNIITATRHASKARTEIGHATRGHKGAARRAAARVNRRTERAVIAEALAE